MFFLRTGCRRIFRPEPVIPLPLFLIAELDIAGGCRYAGMPKLLLEPDKVGIVAFENPDRVNGEAMPQMVRVRVSSLGYQGVTDFHYPYPLGGFSDDVVCHLPTDRYHVIRLLRSFRQVLSEKLESAGIDIYPPRGVIFPLGMADDQGVLLPEDIIDSEAEDRV